MNVNFDDMISAYVEGGLKNKDKEIFENYMNKNPNFKNKVDSIRNYISNFKNKDKIFPSDNFVEKLHSKIPDYQNDNVFNQRYWFSINFKSTFILSTSIILMSLFFINRIQIQNSKSNLTKIKNEKINNNFIVKDSLKTNDKEFPILQVKGSSNK